MVAVPLLRKFINGKYGAETGHETYQYPMEMVTTVVCDGARFAVETKIEAVVAPEHSLFSAAARTDAASKASAALEAQELVEIIVRVLQPL